MKYTQLSLFDYTSQAISEHSEMEKKQLEMQDKLINDGVCVLSLFNGISCGRVALERAGIKVKRYVSFEIDKYANTVARKNYPDDEYYGDVTTADFTQYKGFDLVIGGSPCTYWSIAKTNREVTPDGVGGQLFMHFVRAVRETGCKYFLYENNYSIHKDIKAFILKQLVVEPIMINSALVSAQQRKRCYWTNIPNVEQPADRGILLKDILISSDRQSRAIISSIGRTTTREYFKEKQGQMTIEPVGTSKEKSYCVVATYGKAGLKNPILRKERTMIAEPVYVAHTLTKHCKSIAAEPVIISRPHGFNKGGAIEQKSPTMTSTSSWVHNNKIVEPVRTGSISKTTGQTNRIYTIDGKSICLSASQGEIGGQSGLYAIPVEFDGDIPIKAISQADGKTYTVYKVSNGIIEIKDKTYPIKLKDGYYIIRKLTPIECERLQTLPDNYTEGVSNTQRYKCIGNGWTVEVIAHILRFLYIT